jgi:hypothetical protein
VAAQGQRLALEVLYVHKAPLPTMSQPGSSVDVSAHMGPMPHRLTQYAKAAQHLRMAWLTQSEFPARGPR